MGRGGLEPPTRGFSVRLPESVTPCSDNDLRKSADSCCTKSSAESGNSQAADPDLDAVIAAWATLPEAVRARIVGLVEGATESRNSKLET